MGGIFDSPDYEPYPVQEPEPEPEYTKAPDAPKANVNEELMQQRNARARFLFEQSTGRPPQGPSLEINQPNNQRKLF